jgi:hypothetical protein
MADYFGLNRIISLILVIIPFTAWVCGIITRVIDRCYVAAVVRFFFGYIVWICDLILTIVKGCNCTILRVINC